MESQLVTWVIFAAVLIPSIVFAISFSRKMWVEILKVAVNKSATAFRYLTCGTIDLTEFKMQYMDEENDDDVNGDFDEIKELPANAEDLKGFKSTVAQDHIKKLKKNI